jgi:hypothetical protein
MIADNKRVIDKPRKPSNYSRYFSMAFVSKEDIQCTASVSCRDFMHDQIRTFFNNKTRVYNDGHPYRPELGDSDLNTEELSLMLIFPKKALKSFEIGLQVLNDMETYAGIPLTTAEFVKRKPVLKGGDVRILITGDSIYMHNPHLLSIVTLVLRVCTSNKPFNYKKLDDFIKWYQSGNVIKDSYLMNLCHDKMHLILKHRETIFEGITLEELFPVGICYNFHSKGGIYELCRENSNNKVVNERMKDLINNMS